MNIKVNGKDQKFIENLSLQMLISELRVEDKVMAAAVNMEVVKKENWNSCILKENDKVELLQFVGGG
jgi:sulfur carrier protein